MMEKPCVLLQKMEDVKNRGASCNQIKSNIEGQWTKNETTKTK